MRKFFYIEIVLGLFAVVLYGCDEKENGSIFGMVSVAGTAEPMRGTGVALHYTSSSQGNIGALLFRTVTADDGGYEFNDVKCGEYVLRVEVPGYKLTQYKVVVESGRAARADMQVTPLEQSIPSVKTLPVTNERISGGRATLNAFIIDPGNPTYTECGFVYGTAHNPMIEDEEAIKVAVSSSGAGNYSTTITGLNQEIYYVRAFAANKNGISYGVEEKMDLTIDIPMVYVEGGGFNMGCMADFSEECDEVELPKHYVTLDDYYIGAFEITQKQWEKIMGTTLKDQIAIYPGEVHNGEGENCPMYAVNWNEAQSFCQELSRLTGKKYRLPTEAEWEYAARGGINSNNTQYSGSNQIDLVAWYDGNGFNQVHPVGEKLPNSLGISDMTGNVAEWCQDWAAQYDDGNVHNPQGPSTGDIRIVRGGSFAMPSLYSRVTARQGIPIPGRDRYGDLGFRIVREQ